MLFIGLCKESRIAKTTLKKGNKVGELILSDFNYKIDKLGFTKIDNSSTDTLKSINTEGTYWENVFSNHISVKDLYAAYITKISELNNKKPKHKIKTGQNI